MKQYSIEKSQDKQNKVRTILITHFMIKASHIPKLLSLTETILTERKKSSKINVAKLPDMDVNKKYKRCHHMFSKE